MSFVIKDLTGEEKIFASKIEDCFNLVRLKNVTKYSTFLNERQQALCHVIAKKYSGINYFFSGGYENAERVVLCVISTYEEKDNVYLPISAVTVEYRKQDVLSHRDFLGALMALMIKREQIGDIIVKEGKTVIFTTDIMAPLIVSELKKVGRIGVNCRLGYDYPIEKNQNFNTISDTVASLRLDCVIAAAYKLSREKSAQIISSGAVMINSINCDNNSYILRTGDKISVKGYGKFILDEIGGLSKKGKTYISLKIYI